MSSSDRIAFVTGGAAGIGAAISAQLAKAGHQVIVSDINLEAATQTAKAIEAQRGTATPMALDVGNQESIDRCFGEIERRFGRCDILVNNAGIAKTYPFLDYPLDHWHKVMSINVTGVFLCGQRAARLMVRQKWGRIINIASIAGFRASGGRTAYGTSKAAVIGLTRQMAIEVAEYGVTVNGVAPGPVDTPLTQELLSAKSRESFARAVPMHRYGTPDEIAAVVTFLASAAASYVTGHVIPADGGFLAAGVLEI